MPPTQVPLASTAARAARFDFTELCGQPLGPEDYLRIAKVLMQVLRKTTAVDVAIRGCTN